MAVSKDEIIEAVSTMTVMEIVELVGAMEEKFGVSAAAATPVAVAVTPKDNDDAEEQTEFTVHLASFGEKKIEVIKAVRELTGIGLKEAKDMVDGAPSVVKEMIAKGEAEKYKKRLEEAGASVELK